MIPIQNFPAARITLCILLFATSFTGLAQQAPLRSIPFRYLMLQTIDAMRQLDIRPRKGVERDTPFIRYQILPDTGRFMAFFGAEQTYFFTDTSKRYRYYKNPTLVISRHVDSLLRYSADTTSIAFINAQSAIVHELTHYLQASYDVPLALPNSDEQYSDYFKRPTEQQAFIIAAFFFTRKYNPAKFNEVMSSTKSVTGKLDDLLNYHYQTIGYKVVWKRSAE